MYKYFSQLLLISSYFRLFALLFLVISLSGVIAAQFIESSKLEFIVELFFLSFFPMVALHILSGVFVKCPSCGCKLMFEAGPNLYPEKKQLDAASRVVISSIFSRRVSCVKCGSNFNV
jgi:hypothetical protein